jgi:hypothetical protein
MGKNELLDRENEDMHHFLNALQKDQGKLKLSFQYRV